MFKQKSGLAKSWFLSYSAVVSLAAYFYYFMKKKIINFAFSRIFKDHDPNSRTFQGLEIFPQFQDFPGFSRTVATLASKAIGPHWKQAVPFKFSRKNSSNPEC